MTRHEPETYSFTRYLTAKQTVDDRALHRPTCDALRHSLASTAAAIDRPLRILEVGAGVGTMLDRLLEWGVLPSGAIEYVGVDTDEQCIDRARVRARGLAGGVEVDTPDDLNDLDESIETEPKGPIEIEAEDTSVSVRYVCEDAIAHATDADGFDCVIAMAFLDLIDLPAGLNRLASALTPTGVLYAPVTFDGLTCFRPVADEKFERALLARYHETMDAADRAGGSTTGRKLFDIAERCGLSIVSAGGSDWVVHPNAASEPEGAYTADEAYFLHHIVDTVDGAVRDAIDETGSDNETDRSVDSVLSPDRVAGWADRRHHEIEAGELTYTAHQYDVLFERTTE
ncbi:class I SAM-dependent methyltransferase [Halalkalirubrum salinum]|uniref:class I SAM-dependent methyltransferase n=1 Tax=Halalkalirubrum salinum TaxID=2563889 RepID=UPI0010FBB449|nr:class I SAM-dependent methyltransferase [Halalkalirubrum salinum]